MLASPYALRPPRTKADCAICFDFARQKIHPRRLAVFSSMDVSEIEARIKRIISKSTRLKPEEIESGRNFHTSLGVDSLAVLEIVLSVDQEFNTDFSEQELRQMDSVEKAVQMVSASLLATRG